MKKIDYKKLIISLIIPFAVGFIGSMLGKADDAFKALIKPPFNPPDIVFPIVWSILYFLMGISIYLIWNKDSESEEMKKIKRQGFIYFGISLTINALYNLFFFRLKWLLFSSIWIIILFAFVALALTKFEKINKVAAYIQLPYLIWLSFAFVINYSIYFLNM